MGSTSQAAQSAIGKINSIGTYSSAYTNLTGGRNLLNDAETAQTFGQADVAKNAKMNLDLPAQEAADATARQQAAEDGAIALSQTQQAQARVNSAQQASSRSNQRQMQLASLSNPNTGGTILTSPLGVVGGSNPLGGVKSLIGS